MNDRFGISVGGVAGAIIPFLCGILGALAANVPIAFLDGRVPQPLLSLMPVYFWCMVRPDLLPAGAVFVIGLSEDLLSGGPPGVWALSYLVCFAIIGRQRDTFAGLAGYGAILGFAAIMFIASGTAYVIVSILYSRLLPIETMILELAMSVLFYVPALWLMNAIQHRFIGPLRGDF